MNRFFFFSVLFIVSPTLFGQENEAHFFREDQLFFGIGYTIAQQNEPAFSQDGFSYQLQLVFLRDIPLDQKGNWAVAPGIGLQHQKLSSNLNLQSESSGLLSKLLADKSQRLQYSSVIFPFEIRWRNATPTQFSFWRIHLGTKLAYPIFASPSTLISADLLRPWAPSYYVALGYNTWNLFFEYQAQSLFRASSYSIDVPKTHLINIGLRFYFL